MLAQLTMPNEKHKAPENFQTAKKYFTLSKENILNENIKCYYGPDQPQTLEYSPPESWPAGSVIHPPKVVRISLMHFNITEAPFPVDINNPVLLSYSRSSDSAPFAAENAPSHPDYPLVDYYGEITNAAYFEQERLRAIFTELKTELLDEQIYIDIVDHSPGRHPDNDDVTLSNYPGDFIFGMAPYEINYFGTNFLHLHFGMPNLSVDIIDDARRSLVVLPGNKGNEIFEDTPIPFVSPVTFPPLLSNYLSVTDRFYDNNGTITESSIDILMSGFRLNWATEYNRTISYLNNAKLKFRRHITKIFGYNDNWEVFPPWPMTQTIEFIDDVSPGGGLTNIEFDATHYINNRNPMFQYDIFDRWIQRLIIEDDLAQYGISWAGNSVDQTIVTLRTMIRDHYNNEGE